MSRSVLILARDQDRDRARDLCRRFDPLAGETSYLTKKSGDDYRYLADYSALDAIYCFGADTLKKLSEGIGLGYSKKLFASDDVMRGCVIPFKLGQSVIPLRCFSSVEIPCFPKCIL